MSFLAEVLAGFMAVSECERDINRHSVSRCDGGGWIPPSQVCFRVVDAGKFRYGAVGAFFIAIALAQLRRQKTRKYQAPKVRVSSLTLILRRLQFRQALVTCFVAPMTARSQTNRWPESPRIAVVAVLSSRDVGALC